MAAPKRVLIVDDEPAARAQLRDVIAEVGDLTVVAEVSDGSAAIAAINEHAPDIVFLDIDMPEVDGLGVARATEHLMYQLVFVTAHHQYALQAFDTNAIDYLLKPARPSVIEKCIAKILRQEVLTMERRQAESSPTTLVLSDSGTSRYVRADQVLYVEAIGRYRRLNLTPEGALLHRLDTLLSDTTLDVFEQELQGAGFFRVHRGYLVNLAHVTSLKTVGRRLHLDIASAEEPIPVSRSRGKALREALGSRASRD